MNSGEFRRVLRDNGRLLVALPAPDDLVELRGSGRDRVARTLETFAPDFTLVDRHRVTTTADLELPPFTTFCFRFIGRCDRSRSSDASNVQSGSAAVPANCRNPHL